MPEPTHAVVQSRLYGRSPVFEGSESACEIRATVLNGTHRTDRYWVQPLALEIPEDKEN